MSLKRNFRVILLTASSLVCSASFAAPASYSEIIATERERMQENHPQEIVDKQHQKSTSPSQNNMPVTWGQAINTEHARMQKSLPHDSGQAQSQNKPDTARPSTWGQAIDAEKQRIEQMH